ncbi:MAG: hypothetical protein SWK76_15515 [Actinomycetota bacterium]|nr:hypothetical protein [Actinomycetota bacterium]
MKKMLVALLLFALLVGICCFSGCGGCSCSEEATVHVPDPMEEDEDHTVCGYEFPDEEKLGLPLYKSKVVVTTVNSSTTESDGVLENTGVDYGTTDDFKTVTAWYQDQLGTPSNTYTTVDGKPQWAWDSSEGGYYNLIIVTDTDDGTAISVIKSKE